SCVVSIDDTNAESNQKYSKGSRSGGDARRTHRCEKTARFEGAATRKIEELQERWRTREPKHARGGPREICHEPANRLLHGRSPETQSADTEARSKRVHPC